MTNAELVKQVKAFAPATGAEVERRLERLEKCEAALRVRPIETAPRDGTRILVYFKRHGWLTVAWTESATGIEIWCCDDFKFGPYAIRGYIEPDVLGWLPLPEAARAALEAK